MADDKQSRSLGKVSTYIYLRSIHISILLGGSSLTINRPITKQYKLPDMRGVIDLSDMKCGLI